MAAKRDSFQEKKSKGYRGEVYLSHLLQADGWYVIPTYAYCGWKGDEAPRLQGDGKSFVIPDLDITKDGERRWVEVKTKEGADWTFLTKQFEHGIPFRHYENYLEVQRITGCVVWLFIYEEETRDVLFARIDSLKGRKYEGDKMSRGGMIFFPRDAFEKWMQLPAGYVSKRKMKELVEKNPCHFSDH